MIWILKNWKIAAIGLMFLSIFATLSYIKYLRTENNRLSHTLEVANNNYRICQTQKQNTEKTANEWENKASDIDTKYRAINRKLRGGGSCVPVFPSPSVPDAGAGTTKPSGALGIQAGIIIDEARDCDIAIERLISLQKYLRQFNN